MDRDLSLIEISGDDDSLPHQLLTDDVSSSSNRSYFACSPLQLPRSSTFAHRSFASPLGEGRKVNKDAATPCSSAHSNCANKENTNISKQEVSKFSVDPQKMKRKKKGAGYNLRKSLAWDRAFFTEEGVLDPLELSIISGNYNNIGGEKLSVIHEEARESLSGAMEDAINSSDFPVLEESLFKELPSSAATAERQAGTILPQKNYSPSRNKAGSSNAAKQKVLSTHGVNRSGSKRSGCPRPLTSTSPSTVNVEKTASKELKVSKMRVAKPVPDAISRNVGSTNTERNQIARPAVNVQKNIGTKLSTTYVRSARNETKAGKSSGTNPYTQHTRKNMVNSKSGTNLSMNSQPQRAAKENIGSQRVSSAVCPTSGQASKGCVRVGISLPQNSSRTGGKALCTQAQTMKPSGLRMPSPSLGFFGQSKAPVSRSLLQSTQSSLPKSNIPNVTKGSPLKPICERSQSTPVILTEGAHYMTAGIAGAQRFAPSSVNHTSHEKTESNLQPSNNQKLEDWKSPLGQRPHQRFREEDEDKSVTEVCEDFSGVPNDNEQHGVLIDLLKPSIYEARPISNEKHRSLQINPDFLLPESGSSTEFKKEDCGNRADACLKVQVSIESAAGVDSRKFDAEDAHLHSRSSSILVESGNDILRSLDADNQKLMVVPTFSCEESILKNIMIPEKSEVCITELKSSTRLMPSAVTDCVYNTKDMAKCLHKENKLSSPLISEPAIENCKSPSPQSLDIELHGIEEMERMDKVKSKDAINAGKDEVTIVSPSNRVVSGIELDKEHWTTPNFGPSVVQAEVGKHHNHHAVYDLQSRDDTNHNHLSILMDHDDWSSSATDCIDLPSEQTKLIKPWSHEHDKVCNNENCWRGSYEGFMFDKSRLSEESPKFNRGNTTDVSPETKCSNGNGFEGAAQISQSHSRFHSDENFFLADKSSAQEPAERIELGVVSHAAFEPRDAYGKSSSSDVCARAVPTILDGAVDVDNKTGHLREDDAMLVTVETELKAGSTILGVDLFSRISEQKILEALGTFPRSICCPNEGLVLSAKTNQTQLSGSIPQDIEVTLLENRIFPQEAETSVVEKRSSYDEFPTHHDLDDDSCFTKNDDITVVLKKSDNEREAGFLPMKPPPDAVPFSDEWLAAFEAAGEEILARKGGAVQNSPPDKPVPEPGPWSPVRKNQGAGPFDCTKYINTNVSPHSPS